MRLSEIGIDKWLRAAGIVIIFGLLIEIVSLMWIHALAFALFGFVGSSIIGLGILIYLASLVFASSRPPQDHPSE
jgi:hypothetical protein